MRRRFAALTRRFIAAESGGAGDGFMLFTACWTAAVFCCVQITTSAMTVKFNTVAKVLGSQLGGLR